MGVIANLVVKITASTAEFNKGLAGLGDSVKGISTMMGGMQLGAAFNQLEGAIDHVTELSSHLQDLAEKSGISAEAVQALDFAAKQSGSSFDQISQALALMSKHLVAGDGGTVKALADMGLSLDAIRAMSPDQAFVAIGEAIAKVPDPMHRSADAMALFGRSGATLLPVLTSNLGELTRKAHENGLVMSNELVAAGDAVQDKWTEMQAKAQTLVAQGLTPLLGAFLQMPPALQTSAVIFANMLPVLGSLGLAFTGLSGPIGLLVGALGAATGGMATMLGMIGMLGPGIAMIATAFVAWNIGGWIGEITGLSDAFEVLATNVGEFLGILPAGSTSQMGGMVTLPTVAPPPGFSPNLTGSPKMSDAEAIAMMNGSGPIRGAGMGAMRTIAPTPVLTGGTGSGWINTSQFGNAFTSDDQFGMALRNMPRPPAALQGTSISDGLYGSPSIAGQNMNAELNQAHFAVETFTQDLSGLSQAFAQLGDIGGNSIGRFATSMGSAVTGLNVATQGFSALRNGFTQLTTAGGSALRGITGLIGGFAGIGSAVGLAIRGIGALVNKLRGGEEGTLVNPARDEYGAQFRAQFGGGNSDAVTKALEAAGLGGSKAAALVTAFNTADTMAEFTAATTAIDNALASTKTGVLDVTAANETFNMSLTGSDEAIQQLGQTQLTVTDMMLKGFDSLIVKIDELIGKLLQANAMGGAVRTPVSTAPSDFLGTAPDISGDINPGNQPPAVNFNGPIYGNPEDLAQVVTDAWEGGGDSYNAFRILSEQMG